MGYTGVDEGGNSLPIWGVPLVGGTTLNYAGEEIQVYGSGMLGGPGEGAAPPFGAYGDTNLQPEEAGQLDVFISRAYAFREAGYLGAGQTYLDSLATAGYTADHLGPTLFGRLLDAGFNMSGFSQGLGQVDPFIGSQTINQLWVMSGGEPIAVQDAGVDPLTAITLDVDGDGWIDQNDVDAWDAATQAVLGPGFDDGTGEAGTGGGMTQGDFQTQLAQFQADASARSEANFNRMMTIMMSMMGGQDDEEPYSLMYNPIGGA
ncbi:MAG: hypothetical protein V3S37_03125 [Dehalococcoidia bacterium]